MKLGLLSVRAFKHINESDSSSTNTVQKTTQFYMIKMKDVNSIFKKMNLFASKKLNFVPFKINSDFYVKSLHILIIIGWLYIGYLIVIILKIKGIIL